MDLSNNASSCEIWCSAESVVSIHFSTQASAIIGHTTIIHAGEKNSNPISHEGQSHSVVRMRILGLAGLQRLFGNRIIETLLFGSPGVSVRVQGAFSAKQ